MPLIVLEGIDGCGKGTQLNLLAERLRDRGIEPLCLREPGGTGLGEAIRSLLLDRRSRIDPMAELLAYQTARAQLVAEVLRPALAAARWVLLDRFWYSTLAYQAGGLGLDEALVRSVIAAAVGDLRVDHALLLRLDPVRAAARRAGRASDDRIESRGFDYLVRVAAAYERLAAAGELQAVEADAAPATVAAAIWAALGIREN